MHEMVYGDPPQPEHLRLYEAFPEHRGFSDQSESVPRFEAALHLALLQTIPPEGAQGTFRRSYLLLPRTHQTWAIARVKSIAERMFAGFKAKRQIPLAKSMGKCFEHMVTGHHVLQMHGEPEAWVAFGFTLADPLPSWLGKKLLR
jgi:hypothetical protein